MDKLPHSHQVTPMNASFGYCHDCDVSVADLADFMGHARQTHAITDGWCNSSTQDGSTAKT